MRNLEAIRSVSRILVIAQAYVSFRRFVRVTGVMQILLGIYTRISVNKPGYMLSCRFATMAWF